MNTRFLTAFLVGAALTIGVAPASAQRRGGTVAGRAVPRATVAPRFISPRIIGSVPYRPYFYPYRPGISLGFYAGYPGFYGYPYGYPYGYYGYGSGYGYPYGYYPPAGYLAMAPGHAYGGVRIQGAARDAQVFADGYYVGVVDDFDGTFQHLNLEAGPHRIEIREGNAPPIAFDINVRPGETITYRADK
jgi:hypothetical protein